MNGHGQPWYSFAKESFHLVSMEVLSGGMLQTAVLKYSIFSGISFARH